MRRDQERREDEERWATWQAARHHDWEDWTIAETMNDPGRVGKKQKVYVPAESTQGRILWRSAARVKMQQQESRQIRFQFGEVDVAQEMSSSASEASLEQLQIPQDGEEEDGKVEAADDEVLQTASQTGAQSTSGNGEQFCGRDDGQLAADASWKSMVCLVAQGNDNKHAS